MQIECASSDTHRSTEWEVWLLWWTTVFVWNLPPLRVFCEHRDLLLFCLAPQRAAGKSWEQWEWSLLLLLSLLLAGKCWGEGALLFQVLWGVTSWERGGWTGWPQGDHQLSWSLVLAIWKSVTKSRSHHLKNSRTMRNAQPWAWCFICQRELLVWNLVRWLLQQDHGKFGWYFLKLFAFLRQRIFFFQWQSKVITLNKPLAWVMSDVLLLSN